jgi:hypothetical protein
MPGDDGNPPQGDEGPFARLLSHLGGRTPELERRLIQSFVDFEASLPIIRELRSAEAQKWFKSVSTASRKLADLLENDAQRVFGTAQMGHPWPDWVLKQLLMGNVLKELSMVSTTVTRAQPNQSIEKPRGVTDASEGTHTRSLEIKLIATALARAQPKRLIEELRRLADSADDKGLFPQFRSKKQRHWHHHDLIRAIAIIYEDRTGNRAGRSTNPTTNKPGGPFFRIVRDAYFCLGISKSDEAIALDIRKALKGRQGAVVRNRAQNI